MKIIILGASGLIGNGIKSVLENENSNQIVGTFCSNVHFLKKNKKNYHKFNILLDDKIYDFLLNERPELIINCLGITKHIKDKFSEDNIIKVNSIFPKKLSRLTDEIKSRLIHISTDCVYNGNKGFYSEEDKPNAKDIYGTSKAEAEIIKKNNLVIRTSTIGKELSTKFGLLEWFLSQEKECEGYRNALFSGITTTELGKILQKYFIPNNNIKGLYNVGSNKTDKYELLKIFLSF